MKEKFLELGEIVALHGIKGELRVKPWCNNAEFFCSVENYFLEKGREKINIKSKKAHKNVVVINIQGINSCEDAQSLMGKIIYAEKDKIKLPENEYFICDILGLEVFNSKTNKYYGKITNVFKTGANDVYEITNEKNKKYLIPVIKHVVLNINLEKNTMKIEPIKGIFEDED